ncbi:MAG: polysaccharide deacetylase family protein [Clostridiales bacterium]|nr:polysaccharide deacetylase family protein [Clostridiales bacterium]
MLKKSRFVSFLALFLVLISVAGLCSCGGGSLQVGESSGSSPDTAEPTETTPVSQTVTEDPTKSALLPTESGPSSSEEPTPPVDPTTPEDPTTPVVPLETEEVSAKSVKHVFTHCLINDPQKGCSYAGAPLDADCLTVTEFRRLLESLYENGYCLININDMYVVDANGKARLADTVTVNKGKKPLVISIDDVTYDPRKKGSGMVDRLVIENGTIMGCYDNADGSTTLTDGEVFPIVEAFVKEHPDFSYNGNKVTLALTGFAGILGYRTDERYEGQYDVAEERRKAKEVVDWLNENGYNFACHTYSHANYTTCSDSRVREDLEKWDRNVKPLIGETRVLVYPYGAFTYQDTNKHNALLQAGYVVFCGTSQLNTLWDGSQPKQDGGAAKNTGTIYLERFTVTGATLRPYASLRNFVEYYTSFYKDLGYDEESAKKKAEDRAANDTYGFEATRENTLIYYKPEQIYDTENRYYKIYTDEV